MQKGGSFVSSERIDSPTEQTINHTTNLTPFEENIQKIFSRRITAGSDLFFQKIAWFVNLKLPDQSPKLVSTFG